MKKKIFLMLALTVFFVCIFMLSVSATTFYYDIDGSSSEPIFQYEMDENKIITSYSGAFAKENSRGEPISWYIVEKTSLENGDVSCTVKSFVTSDPEYCKIQPDGRYMFKTETGVSKNTIVSINFPNDMGIKSFSNGSSYNFCANTGPYAPDVLELLFAYFPNTWTIVDRIVQATKVLEVYFDSESLIEELGDTSFYGCKSLRHVQLPPRLKTLKNGSGTFYDCASLEHIDLTSVPLETIGSAAFANCKSLKYIEIPNTVTTIGGNAFSGSGLVELRLPASVTVVGERIVQGCNSLKKFYFSPNQTNITQSITYLSGALQYVYVPNTITEATGSHHFTTQHASYMKSVLFFAGTREEAEAFITLIGNRNNEKFYTSDFNNFLEWDESISDDEYVAKAVEDNRHYVVYGYSRCGAFFGGHSWSGEDTVVLKSYFSEIGIGDTCNGCGISEIKSTIEPLFTSRGISVKTFGNDVGLIQGYEINKASIEAYRAYAPDFDFGVLAYANVGGAPVSPKPGENKVIDISFDKMANDYIEIKLVAIPESYRDVPLVFCIYVTEGERFYYLNDGITSESLIGDCYNDILG